MTTPLSPKKNQPKHDLVYTPFPLAKEIIDHFNPSGKVLDPCRGGGAFLEQFPDNCVGYYCEIQEGTDFLQCPIKVDWIITNPPWSKIREFLEHSYSLADNIVFLVTINHIVTKARMRKMKECGFGIKEIYGVKTPSSRDGWPQSGFQLAACHIAKDYLGPVTFSGVFGY